MYKCIYVVMNEFINLLYPPAGTAGGYFGFSSVTPPPPPPRPPPRHILVCALTATFLDGFFSNFVWKCILVISTRLVFLVMLPPEFRLLQGQRSYFGWHYFVCSNSCISGQIFFKFCMKVYLGTIYALIVYSGAAPSVPSFTGSKVIFWLTFFCVL